MLEKGPVKVTVQRDYHDFEPIQATRQNEQIIGLISFVSEGRDTAYILEKLRMKRQNLQILLNKAPSLPHPYDWESTKK